jgi:hypothetical protein
MTRKGNCLVFILAGLVLIWLIFMGGCQLIQKKTQEGLEDKPAPTQPVKPEKG